MNTNRNKVYERMYKLAEVSEITGLSRCTIYRNVESGHFPPPQYITKARIAWSESVLQAWFDGLS